MNNPKNKLIRNVAASYIGILFISGLLSLVLHFDFGVNLFFLGVLVSSAGAFLGGSLSSIKPTSPGHSMSVYSNRPNEELSNQISYQAAHPLPPDTIENVMMFAGLAALLSSLPFVIVIVFGK